MSIKKILKEQESNNKKIFRMEGYFDCSNNNFQSLEGSPDYVGESFYCSENDLKSLEGCPDHVGRSFICFGNYLQTLEGCPDYVGRDFDCSYNDLVSLEGCPEYVGKDFVCIKNSDLPEEEIIKLKESGKVKGTIYSDYGEF